MINKHLFFLIAIFLSLSFISAFNFQSTEGFNFQTNSIADSRVDNFIGNCTAGYVVFGVDSNGNKICVLDQAGGGGVENPFDQWLNTTNSPSFNALTLTGGLIMQALISSQDIIPVTDSLYSLGNSTNRFSGVYADNVDTTNLSADDIGTNTFDANRVNATNVSSSRINISGYEITDEGGDLTINLN